MSFLSITKDYDLIGSITHPKVAQKIADNITKRIPLFYFLNKLGNKEHEDGGEKYVLGVLKELPSAQAYIGTDPLTNPETDSVTSAIYERKQITVPVNLTGTKLLKNSGGVDSIIGYMETVVEVGEEGMKDALAGSSIGIFSSQNEDDTGITGLQTFLTTSVSTGSVGRLSRVSFPFWRHKLDSVTTGFATDGLTSMRNLWIAVSRGNEKPTVIIVTPTTYANLLKALVGTINYNTPSPKTSFGDIDFEHVNFHGAPVIFDDGVPANTGYFLNLKYFKLLVHKDRDMTIRDFIQPTNQDTLLGRIYWAGNLVCNNLKAQGILTGSPDATG